MLAVRAAVAVLAVGLVAGQAPAPAPTSTVAATLQTPNLTLPALSYSFSGLEPSIDNLTVFLHHTKHQQTYINNVNEAIIPYPALKALTLLDMVKAVGTPAVPEKIATAVRNNAGGAFNHILYFNTLAPVNSTNISVMAGPLTSAFGSVDGFKKNFTEAALTVFGSGWAWLTVPAKGGLEIAKTPNQDSTLMTGLGYDGSVPILGIDVWEHSYYLKYKNVRAEYIANWYNIVDWNKVASNYQAATSQGLQGFAASN